MKKSIINFLLLAAAIVLGVSCQKETNADNAEIQLEDCSVSASVLGTDTKVTLDGVTPKWETGDKILVLDANKKPLGETGEFTLETGDGSNSGTFKGTKYFGQTPAYAIYPASVYNKATGKFTLPTEQDGTQATTFKDYAVMMGTVLSGNITFANVCAVLKINTGDYGKTDGEVAIKSLKVSAATSAIAGEFTPNWTNNTIAPAEGGTVSQEVTATATGEGGYDNDTDIYLALIPSASQALTFEFTNTDDEVATVTDTFAPATNTIKGLGTAGGMEFKTPGPDPNYWVDLGAVTKDGHKLLFARYNVASIDANGNATFDETLGGSGNKFTSEQALSIKTAAGSSCRLPEPDELISIFFDLNTDYNLTGNIVTLTSKISGLDDADKSLIFPYQEDFVTGSDSYTTRTFSINGSRARMNFSAEGFVRLVVVLEESIPVVTDYFEVYYTSSGQAPEAIPPYTCNIENGDYLSNMCWYITPHPAQVFSNQYRLLDFSKSSDVFEIEVTPTGAETYVSHDFSKYYYVDDGEDYNFTIKNLKTLQTLSFYCHGKVCFVSGTLITLADGSKKPIEDITYDDELKVWNFDKGCYDTAKIFWLTKAGQTTEQYYKMTFSDGTVLNILGPQYKSGHKLYNYTDRKFEGVKTLEVGKEVYTENGVVTLVSKEEVNEEVEFYCLMTEDHLNCFAEGVLASLRYNNIYPFDENMKFIKDDRSRRPYKEFKAIGISREWYVGLRLGEQTDDLETIKKYVDRYDARPAKSPLLPSGSGSKPGGRASSDSV